MQAELTRALEELFGPSTQIKSTDAVGGGCINQAQVLRLSNGERIFLKSNQQAPLHFFEAEARGLRLLASADNGPLIPRPLIQPRPDTRFLLLEYIEETRPGPAYSRQFGEALAALHRVTQAQHGLDHNNFIGLTRQINTLESDGVIFFREHRLRFQQELARERNLLPSAVDQKLDRLLDKLEILMDLKGEPPALLHGDLWSGNHFSSGNSQACLFDPAVYYGYREADIAMTRLFGALSESTYSAYQSAFPLTAGWQERTELFNLYHLLNHLNLFGESYLGSVRQIINRYI
ncbi:MAG: fructosamine kinase family protein [Candidatus Nitrohelix vancouverensis]|uniref:Fructosamine kinase family protein n=1 Tax=Candidatus Nitrohelix vancouverensis TaxID=2705534 RepID=A0A7T0C1T7_9BACT|nr:MAG: fructosamine kinase family protein [Candidatus Nitrohelix vancouverensis]